MRIVVENVSKKFKKNIKRDGALAKFLSFVSSRQVSEDFLAVKNVSLKIPEGKNLGIIGDNGSGKTTLLRMIAGIYEPTNGTITTQGKMLCLSNLSNGLKTKLTVKDNVFLVGTILGLSQKQIKEKFDEIIKFSGLNDFVYANINQLSGGMKQRIVFSITMHCADYLNPDIILLDEVFAGGGDEAFKEMALDKIQQLIKSDKTIVMVSHKMPIIRKYCEQVVCMNHGKIIEQGESQKVIKSYLESVEDKKKERKRWQKRRN